MAGSYRKYALAHPRTYSLAFGALEAEMQIDPATAEGLVLPLQAAFVEYVGQDRSLDALRGYWALLHGFTSLEINGQFRRGGDLNVVFERSVRAYIAGWSR
jgi:hypothetical protein